MATSQNSVSPKEIATLARSLESWFVRNQRPLPWRERYDPYQVWVSEIMLQQTRMEVVIPYFLRFVEQFPDLRTLAAAGLPEVLALWSGLGYYRRARMLHAGAQYVVEELGGEIPSDVAALRRIPGVGRYTAGAIASIGFDVSAPIVDGNVLRIFSRLAALEAPGGSSSLTNAIWLLAEQVVNKARSPRRLNQGLMELGALICRPRNPLCEACPIAVACRGRERAAEFPRAALRRERIELTIPLLVVRDRRGRVLLERVEGEIMRGLFHLPHGSAALLADSSGRFVAQARLGSFRHTITFRNITFELFQAEQAGGGSIAENRLDAVWVEPGEAIEVAHPSYVDKAMRLLAD